jgi:hypothetical protein
MYVHVKECKNAHNPFCASTRTQIYTHRDTTHFVQAHAHKYTHIATHKPGPVAHWLEALTADQKVWGSIPTQAKAK